MSQSLSSQLDERRLNALDPGFAFLAIQAALEIELLIEGRATGLVHTKELSQQLIYSDQDPILNGSIKNLMDPSTITVLSQIVSEERTEPIKTTEELVSEAASIADRLTEATSNKDQGHLTWARAFCYSLARGADTYRQRLNDFPTPHPFRR